jgi:hypothetical protein
MAVRWKRRRHPPTDDGHKGQWLEHCEALRVIVTGSHGIETPSSRRLIWVPATCIDLFAIAPAQ